MRIAKRSGRVRAALLCCAAQSAQHCLERESYSGATPIRRVVSIRERIDLRQTLLSTWVACYPAGRETLRVYAVRKR